MRNKNTYKLKVPLQPDELKAENKCFSFRKYITESSLWSRNGMSAVVTCICSQLESAEWEELFKFCVLIAQHPRSHWKSWDAVAGGWGWGELCVGGVVKEKEN